jgi:hypothetical protein
MTPSASHEGAILPSRIKQLHCVQGTPMHASRLPAAMAAHGSATPPRTAVAEATPARGARSESVLCNKHCTGLVRIMGQVQTSDRDSQSKHWTKTRHLGQPSEIHLCAALRGGGAIAGRRALRRGMRSPRRRRAAPAAARAVAGVHSRNPPRPPPLPPRCLGPPGHTPMPARSTDRRAARERYFKRAPAGAPVRALAVHPRFCCSATVEKRLSNTSTMLDQRSIYSPWCVYPSWEVSWPGSAWASKVRACCRARGAGGSSVWWPKWGG